MDLSDLAMMLEGVDVEQMSSTHPSFLEAADKAKGLKHLDSDTQLQLYGLYKQSTMGDITTSKPWALDMIASAKWNAWKSFEGFPKDSAARTYVYVVSNLLPPHPRDEGASPSGRRGGSSSGGSSSSGSGSSSSGSGSSSSGSGSGSSSSSSRSSSGGGGSGGDSSTGGDGPVASNTPSIFDGMGITISTLHASQEQEYINTAIKWKESEALFAAVVEGDLEKVRDLVKTPGFNVNLRNDGGSSALHFAVDRGHIAAVKLLLENGADRNAMDDDDQTPLMIAQICEYADIEELLSTENQDP